MAITGDHGLRVLTYTTPESMMGLDPSQMLGLQPFWFTDSDFYLADGTPAPEPGSKSDWDSGPEVLAGSPRGGATCSFAFKPPKTAPSFCCHPRLRSSTRR